MWFEHKDFSDLIDSWWKSYDVQGDPDVILAKKLSLLKADIKKWNKEVFGCMETKKNKVLERLEQIDHGLRENQNQEQLENERNAALMGA